MSSPDGKGKLDQVVGRALRDEEFRNNLTADPKTTLQGEGLSDEDVEAVAGGALNAYNIASLNFSKVEQTLQKVSLQDIHFTSKFVKGSTGLG
jgi:hypothetical protein